MHNVGNWLELGTPCEMHSLSTKLRCLLLYNQQFARLIKNGEKFTLMTSFDFENVAPRSQEKFTRESTYTILAIL